MMLFVICYFLIMKVTISTISIMINEFENSFQFPLDPSSLCYGHIKCQSLFNRTLPNKT